MGVEDSADKHIMELLCARLDSYIENNGINDT